MIDAFTARHYEHVSTRTFEEVVAAFEAATGSVEDGYITKAAGAAKSPADSRPTFDRAKAQAASCAS